MSIPLGSTDFPGALIWSLYYYTIRPLDHSLQDLGLSVACHTRPNYVSILHTFYNSFFPLLSWKIIEHSDDSFYQLEMSLLKLKCPGQSMSLSVSARAVFDPGFYFGIYPQMNWHWHMCKSFHASISHKTTKYMQYKYPAKTIVSIQRSMCKFLPC